MTTRYRKELEQLGAAYAEARAKDVRSLSLLVERLMGRPLIAVGSGGSFSVASFACCLHEQYAHALARAATPLEVIGGVARDCAVMCFSASGRNRDICSAFTAAAMSEARPLAALVLVDASPLHDLGKRFQYSDVLGFGSPLFKDGFLAVASMLASATLLTRAYREVAGITTVLPDSLDDLVRAVTGVENRFELGTTALASVSMASVSVIHTPALRPAATDLESRFIEAALGRLHAADLRNFGHGRHHWFAKRGEETGVVALIGDNQGRLADRTLELLPQASPCLRIDFHGEPDLQALVGLVTALHLAEYAGSASGIDPGKPGVPEFGRKLYRLGPGVLRPQSDEAGFIAAVRRKAPAARLGIRHERDRWLSHYSEACTALAERTIDGIAFDYDGTLCDARHRFEPVSKAMADALVRQIEAGAVIGIATGRGGSAGTELRRALPKVLWSSVVIGYYNGSVVAGLDDEEAPRVAVADGAVLELDAALRREPTFSESEIRTNAAQIAIRKLDGVTPFDAIGIARRVADRFVLDVRVTCSSHSIDVVMGKATKLAVVDALTARCTGSNIGILRVGDRGRWPGNDADLLDDVLGLSVDEASPSPVGCWGLTPPGVLGPPGTLFYLHALTWKNGKASIYLGGSRRRAAP